MKTLELMESMEGEGREPATIVVSARTACGSTWVCVDIDHADGSLCLPFDPQEAAKLGRMLIEQAATAHGAAVAMRLQRLRIAGES